MSEAAVDIVSRKRPGIGGNAKPLSAAEIEHTLENLDGCCLRDGSISKTFRYPNHWQAVAFARYLQLQREDPERASEVQRRIREHVHDRSTGGIRLIDNDAIFPAEAPAACAIAEPYPCR